MRVSQRQMFSQYICEMNNSLSGLMDSNNQGSTGKKINRPSDDPANMARVMMYRESLSNIDRNKANISEATGWLNLADHGLMQVSDIISKIKALDLQGATSTVNADNRQQVATQLRALFGELLNVANTEYNGQHIFAGHKVENAAYVESLAVTSHQYEDPATPGTYIDLNRSVDFVTTGGTSSSVQIQFTESGTLDNQPAFIYSKDGGKTWQQGSWTTGTFEDPKYAGLYNTAGLMDCGGAMIEPVLKDYNGTWPQVVGVTTDMTDVNGIDYSSKESAGGTWLSVRPTAIYKGDDHDTQTTQQYGASVTGLKGEGSFARDVSVRVKSNDGNTIEYEYSLDNGSNWIKATAPAKGGTPPVHTAQLAIPGGYVSINPPTPAYPTPATNGFQGGQEFLVHPRRADINFEISSTQTITVNNVGKDIFGGLYQEPFTNYATTVGGVTATKSAADPNLFETVGKLIGYCELNDQNGIQRCMDELTECLKVVTTKLADVGGRENRLTVAFETASIRELSEDNARSSIEDVDTITLMTKLAQQQLAYNTVLKSSSMIMQMSLMNFI
ncbi:Flagellar hook-associated protein 3 [uncultured delta proteobacterium]|uniref:Flagellar hook-associated protein 3 n=1 Tax=uncultured delta proteobacterium TaxID=34034 RepID=A0A212JLR6_9DELT|nr:Flagellar hook-associated protein 3 [uncultured delta proteobacterium]